MVAVALALAAAPAAAQSLLERTPNVDGPWVGSRGQIHFHFVHRFQHSGAPERQVQNRPTFLLAGALTPAIMAGARYATRSELAPGIPNEWELFVRARPFTQQAGAPADLAVQLGRNAAADSWDAELSAARAVGPLRAILAVRALSDAAGADGVAAGVAIGGIARLTRHVALAADAGRIWSDAARSRIAWGAGIHVHIPHSPHSFSLHATNVSATTLHSASHAADRVRWGFEFTVPVTLRRYLNLAGGTGVNGADEAAAPHDATGAASDSVVIVRAQNLRYEPAVITVAAGTIIEWRNDDPLEHTVTAADGSWDSGMIAPGAAWRRRFDAPGRYPYVCTPHPFMQGEVVVR